MGSMMNGDMMCGAPMVIGMGFAALLLVLTLGLIATAAVKYLTSGAPVGDHNPSSGYQTGDR